ncbi:helix-turn-helix domain-containing protein [Flavobacterium acetivorans]|uniref:helix-turn-helix domain-containing protein n=1 Tax=Flavobacterium acetivorans TaxID=2893883 RepID=UPI001E62317D|nr:AraC family transcriptional regulator [Flavobacterium sp. F-29]UFH34713.1 AraC family transcriptional regulator [Flavobacterium sp. F-29]
MVVPCFCTISRLTPGTSILVSAVITVIANTIAAETLVSADDPDLSGVLNSYSDVQLMQDVYDYILNHLDLPLPSMKALSRIFGTNENKLKYGFKHLFKMGIYEFYAIERLKRAHLLIQQTTIPLKSIAIMAGYPIYPNFSRAFKKRFGYTPMDVKRRLSGVLLWMVSTELWAMSYGLWVVC